MTIKDTTETKHMSCSEDIVSIFEAILNAECEIDQDKEHFWTIG